MCGFSFGRNLTKLNYPVEAAVQSVLPLCRRFVFAVGRSDDDTRQRVEAIDTSSMNGGRGGAIDIVDTVWPDVRVDGKVLAVEANKAMEAAEAIAEESGCTWGFYIQADEVIHEDDLWYVHSAMEDWADQKDIKALLFRYLHFVLDYETVDPWMYHKACRVVRLDGSCKIYGDACGPGFIDPPPHVLEKNDGYLDKKHLGIHVQWAQDLGLPGMPYARVFHYGWVKTPEQLDDKFAMVDKLWWGTLSEEEKQRRKANKFGAFVERYPILKKFRGPGKTHPALMRERIARHPRYAPTASRWLNPRFYLECLKHGFHG
ncbi:MAG: hypothetical protein AAF333_17105 [Planctomycetota bacterium]